MKFVLISRHTGGREIPESESAQNLEDMTEWLGALVKHLPTENSGRRMVAARQW